MKIENLKWIQLRNLIILLGEYQNWWPAKVISGKGEEFLDYILPKTKTSAVQQLATEICRLEHDNKIGPGRYHIFRLPQKWEEEIFNTLKNMQYNYEEFSEDVLMNELLKMSSDISVSTSKGPLMIGAHNELNDPAVFQSFAKHYYEAFKNEYRTYPYLN